MNYRSLLIPGAIAGALMLPISANAKPPCHWGPDGNCAAVVNEALKSVSIDLEQAVKSAQGAAKGQVVSARLSPFGLPGEEGRNAFSPPSANPSYLVSISDGTTRSLVKVDAKSGNAEVIGTATGVLAKTGPMGMGAWQHKGGHKGWGGPRGFGPVEDMSAFKIGAADAVEAAKGALKDSRPVMVRAVRADDDTAWMVTMKSGADTTPKSMTMVFVDTESGKVLDTRAFEPGDFGPRGPGGPGGRGPGERGPGGPR